MRVAKFAVLAVAVAAGVGAVYLVQTQLEHARLSAVMVSAPAAPVEEVVKTRVLVATARFKRGHIFGEGDFEWREWPESAVLEAFITNNADPEAPASFVGAVVSSGFSAGEPIIRDKIIDVNHPGAVAAMLRPGLRGFAIRVAPETGAGGFIVPGNYVDIILTRNEDVEHQGADGEWKSESILFTDTLLTTVRVLAVDQVLDDEGQASLPMKDTITIEITAEQAELLSLAEQAGRLTLAVRSIAELVDANGDRIIDPLPELAIDLADFAGASLGFTEDKETPTRADAAAEIDLGAYFARAERAASVNDAAAPQPAPPAAEEAASDVTVLRYTSVRRVRVRTPSAEEQP